MLVRVLLFAPLQLVFGDRYGIEIFTCNSGVRPISVCDRIVGRWPNHVEAPRKALGKDAIVLHDLHTSNSFSVLSNSFLGHRAELFVERSPKGRPMYRLPQRIVRVDQLIVDILAGKQGHIAVRNAKASVVQMPTHS